MPWKTGAYYTMEPRIMVLQCGHGGDAVEDRKWIGPKTRNTVTFNAATAVMPWKTSAAPRLPTWRWAFNAATAVMPWKTRP